MACICLIPVLEKTNLWRKCEWPCPCVGIGGGVEGLWGPRACPGVGWGKSLAPKLLPFPLPNQYAVYIIAEPIPKPCKREKEPHVIGYNPEIHHRHALRLKHYDYSQPGAYFVTICSWQRKPLFTVPALHTSITEIWKNLPDRFPTISVDDFVVMPNNIHGIVWLKSSAKRNPKLSAVIGAYKSLTTVAWLEWNKRQGLRCPKHLWQERYYDHVVRNDYDLLRVREYMMNNPLAALLKEEQELDEKAWKETLRQHGITVEDS